MPSGTYLDAILAWHRRRAADDARSLSELADQAASMSPARGFAAAIDSCRTLAVIAEVKRRSPSKGDLAVNLDPALLAATYERAGASCVSVLTDSEHFGGSPIDLSAAHGACALPVLRKDFTVDARDVCDARLMGADCVLLIAAALDAAELREYHTLARQIGLDALVEVHDERELDIALDCGATLVGVNQRDLVTFQVDHERAVRMGAAFPAGVTSVAESGVRGRADAEALREAGYDAVLVGEHLVTATDTGAALADLLVG
ncbi:MAG: indole-3-glycerol phosphate synthase TrpC [Ilumatobacteraceae bacterium]